MVTGRERQAEGRKDCPCGFRVCSGPTAAPANAIVYFIIVKNGDTVKSPFKVKFGLSGMGVAPAGVEKPNTGMLTPKEARLGQRG